VRRELDAGSGNDGSGWTRASSRGVVGERGNNIDHTWLCLNEMISALNVGPDNDWITGWHTSPSPLSLALFF